MPAKKKTRRHPLKRNLAASNFFTAVAMTIILAGLLKVWGIATLWAYLLSVNLVSFGFFGWDKFQAKRGENRIPELTLHGIALIGGTLGGIAGQQCFRHKRVKPTFQRYFWAIVALQLIVVVVLATK